MALRAPRSPTAGIDEAIGFVGFFGVVFTAVTVFCELTGRPALGWALTLLVCVLALVALWRWRVAVLRRTTADRAPVGGDGRGPAGMPGRVGVSGRDGGSGVSGRPGVGRDHLPGGARIGDR